MHISRFFMDVYPFDGPPEYLEFLAEDVQDRVAEEATAQGVELLPGPMHIRRVEGLFGDVGYRFEWLAAKTGGL